ncbi:MAG TPA: lipopolysaccharide assembly protein LapA domain-containing protein [Actinoplanes sp.]|nr:lipopolysaccharide assembly protein LapA domain-containing protein [Actinoplanes sp.]
MTSPSDERIPESDPPPPPPVPAGTDPDRTGDAPRIAPTRTSTVWMGVWAGVVALILLIIFIGQNTASVEIAFFALEGRIPLALALLIAGVAGAIIAMAVAAMRILQLRRLVRRGR